MSKVNWRVSQIKKNISLVHTFMTLFLTDAWGEKNKAIQWHKGQLTLGLNAGDTKGLRPDRERGSSLLQEAVAVEFHLRVTRGHCKPSMAIPFTFST